MGFLSDRDLDWNLHVKSQCDYGVWPTWSWPHAVWYKALSWALEARLNTEELATFVSRKATHLRKAHLANEYPNQHDNGVNKISFTKFSLDLASS